MYLDIDLKSWNPAVIKMERVPVLIFVSDLLKKTANYMSKDEIKANQKNTLSPLSGYTTTLDRFLSGFFIVDGFKLYYDAKYDKVIAKYRLTRREWGVPQDDVII